MRWTTFHTGGRRATAELLELVALDAGAHVLDVGAGLGGTARMVASRHGCHVTCLEPPADFCRGARLLNRLTGLEGLVDVQQAAVPPVPLADASVDVALMQNVGMCIADKRGLYREVRRVLRPGGRFAFQEMAAGSAGGPPYPLPWADGPTTNFLVTEDELERALTEAGLVRETFEDVTASELARPSTGAAQGPYARRLRR